MMGPVAFETILPAEGLTATFVSLDLPWGRGVVVRGKLLAAYLVLPGEGLEARWTLDEAGASQGGIRARRDVAVDLVLDPPLVRVSERVFLLGGDWCVTARRVGVNPMRLTAYGILNSRFP